MKKTRIYLVGFMGSGKSTVGSILADQLDWQFLDLDELIEAGVETSIPEIFRRRGEASFRQLELKYLDRVSRMDPPVVVATGGGLPVKPRNRRIMKRSGTPVHLAVSPETAAERVGDDPGRPLFQDMDQVRDLWKHRRAAYKDIPRSVETEGRSPQQVAEDVYRLLAGDT